MKAHRDYACPRCAYALVPVFAIEGTRRRVVALTCPEPYCDHMQMLSRDRASEYQRQTRSAAPKRAAN